MGTGVFAGGGVEVCAAVGVSVGLGGFVGTLVFVGGGTVFVGGGVKV